MKKYLFVVVIALISVVGNAQSYTNAIGVRGSLAAGLTFKHMLGDSKGLEFIAASRWRGYSFTGLFEIHAQAFDVEGLNWYYGFGAHIGSWKGYKDNRYFNGYRIDNNGNYVYDNYTVIGIDGIIGIEYNISEIPINISLDYKPAFNLIGYTGFWGDNGALSIRYYF